MAGVSVTLVFIVCFDVDSLDGTGLNHFSRQRDKGRTIGFNKQNFENKAFQVFFFASENQYARKIQTENKTHEDKTLKINSIQVKGKTLYSDFPMRIRTA